MTIDITKITPEKLAEMNDSLLVDNTHLRDTVANLRKQVATTEQSLARLRNQVRDECYNALQKVMVTDHSLRTYKRCLDAIRAMKEPE